MKYIGLLSLIFFAVTGMAAAQQDNVGVVKKPQITDMDKIQSDILQAPKQKPLWRGDLPDITKQLQTKPSPTQDSDQDISPDDDSLGQQSAADDNTDNTSADPASQNSQPPVTDTNTSENTQATGTNKDPQSAATPAITLPIPSANAPDNSTTSQPPAANSQDNNTSASTTRSNNLSAPIIDKGTSN